MDVYAGVDLGGTTIQAVIVSDDGTVKSRRVTDTQSHAGPDHVLTRIGDLVSELVSDIGGRLGGVGIGVPGLVDLDAGSTKFLPNLPTQWRDVPVASRLGQRLGCPVRILNDVRTAALGELMEGHGKRDAGITLAFFSIGTGIGGGVAVDGKLRLGSLGSAGELGHQTVVANGPRCGCGNHGCLEAVASGPAIAAEGIKLMRMGLAPHLHQLVSGDAGAVTTRELAAAAEHDSAIAEALERAARYIGLAAANVVTILHPDLIVLGGGVAEIGERLIGPIRNEIQVRVGMFPTDDVRVERSLLGDQAGVIGASVLARTGLR